MSIESNGLFQKYLYEISEKNLLLNLQKLLIDRGDIDTYKFMHLVNIEATFIKNKIVLSLANMGITLIVILMVYEFLNMS